jgi:hypothetical protein
VGAVGAIIVDENDFPADTRKRATQSRNNGAHILVLVAGGHNNRQLGWNCQPRRAMIT